MAKNIPTDLLRSFVTVVDLGSFTRAAEALGRTQPAVSLQIRRLEELLQAKLVVTEGRQLMLTDEGVALGPYARQMLRLNDDIVAYFADDALTGWIRVGLPTDFAHSFLLDAISRFAVDNPDVRIEVESLLSKDLRDALGTDKLDIAVGIAPEKSAPYLVHSTEVVPFWVVSDTFSMPSSETLPVLRHPDPCEYAVRMRSALRSIGRSWQTTLVARDVTALQTAVRAGLGATALTPATLTHGMRMAREDEGFPPLDPLRIGLFYKHAALSKAGQGLASYLLDHIRTAGHRASA